MIRTISKRTVDLKFVDIVLFSVLGSYSFFIFLAGITWNVILTKVLQMFHIKVFLLLTTLHVAYSYVPGELCTEEDMVRKRCIKWVSTPKNDVLYSYVQTSKAATCAIHKTTSKYTPSSRFILL